MEALCAAVYAGADAVYFGAKLFNARINADNFDGDGLRRAIYFCHEHNVKTNITLNTLISDSELSDAAEQAVSLYEAGADALIVADVGLAKFLRVNYPFIELHASTQMCGENSYSAKQLSDIGFSRMVCAREASLKDIKILTEKSPIETEIFIHGALCVSHSGMCLMSSVIGNRSGNRGLCAQPCRLPYRCVNGYPLSLKDLSLASHIPEILGTGVASLKIEGRMKSPSYVAGVTEIYRRLIDEKRAATKQENERLMSLFSRSGFTDAYFTSNITHSMLGVRTESDKASSKGAKTYKIPENLEVPADSTGSCARVPVKYGAVNQPSREKSAYYRYFKDITEYALSYFDRIFVPLSEYLKYTSDKAADGVVGIELPPVCMEREADSLISSVKLAVSRGCKKALVTNMWQIKALNGLSLELHGDMRLNVYNSLTASYYKKFLKSVIISPELGLKSASEIRSAFSAGYVVYGRLPVMTLEKCVIKEIVPIKTAKCDYCSSHPFTVLTDRRGMMFPVSREAPHRNVIYNSVPVYMGDKKDRTGLFEHFIFTDEGGRADSVIRMTENGESMKPNTYKRL